MISIAPFVAYNEQHVLEVRWRDRTSWHRRPLTWRERFWWRLKMRVPTP